MFIELFGFLGLIGLMKQERVLLRYVLGVRFYVLGFAKSEQLITENR